LRRSRSGQTLFDATYISRRARQSAERSHRLDTLPGPHTPYAGCQPNAHRHIPEPRRENQATYLFFTSIPVTIKVTRVNLQEKEINPCHLQNTCPQSPLLLHDRIVFCAQFRRERMRRNAIAFLRFDSDHVLNLLSKLDIVRGVNAATRPWFHAIIGMFCGSLPFTPTVVYP